MTKIERYPLTCSMCSKEFEADLYETVNVTLNPELIKTIFELKFNAVECPRCNARSYVPIPFYFHDQKDKTGMILVKKGEMVDFYHYLKWHGYFDQYKTKNPFILFCLKALKFPLNILGLPKWKHERIYWDQINWKELIEGAEKKKEL